MGPVSRAIARLGAEVRAGRGGGGLCIVDRAALGNLCRCLPTVFVFTSFISLHRTGTALLPTV